MIKSLLLCRTKVDGWRRETLHRITDCQICAFPLGAVNEICCLYLPMNTATLYLVLGINDVRNIRVGMKVFFVPLSILFSWVRRLSLTS